jgi:hypothetical protein
MSPQARISEKRRRTAIELANDVRNLQEQWAKILEGHRLRTTAQFEAVLLALDGAPEAPAQAPKRRSGKPLAATLPPVRALAELQTRVKHVKTKPEKARVKDLARIERTLQELLATLSAVE